MGSRLLDLAYAYYALLFNSLTIKMDMIVITTKLKKSPITGTLRPAAQISTASRIANRSIVMLDLWIWCDIKGSQSRNGGHLG